MTKQRAARWLGLSALWIAIGLGLSVEVYCNVRVADPDVPFLEVARQQSCRAIFWALLAPVVVKLRDSVPLNTGRWVGGVSFHAVVSITVMLCCYLLRQLVPTISRGGSLGGFWPMAAKGFYGRNLIDMVCYWAVIGVSYAVRTREQSQRESLRAAQLGSRLIEAELRALKRQLNPHFLCNTMNTISVPVRDPRNDEAGQLIARLSSRLRISLDNARVRTGTVEIPARVQDRQLQPVAKDDGPGFDVNVRPARPGIGLTDTRVRLERHYGHDFQMAVKSEKGHGGTVSLVLPIRPMLPA